MQKLQVNDFILMKNGTLARVVRIGKHENFKYRGKLHCVLRVAKPCGGCYSDKSRIGMMYTYQHTTFLDYANKNYERIGTQEILSILFNVYKSYGGRKNANFKKNGKKIL